MSVVFFGYCSFLHQSYWPPRYNWNIVENGIKHHKPNSNQENVYLLFSSPDPKGHVSYSHHLASVVRPSSVVRRKLFQKSSPLKVLDQWKPNLVWIITRVSSFKIVSGDAVHQPTWPLLLKIEHMVKLQVFGNNSKTVSNIKNLTWGKNDQHIKIYLPCNFEVNLNTHLGVIALFSSNL